eukprot:403336017
MMSSQPSNMMSQEQLLQHTLAKIPKYSFTQIRNHLNQDFKMYFQSEADLKHLDQKAILQLISAFMRETLELDSQSVLTENYYPEYFSMGLIPQFEKLDETLMKTEQEGKRQELLKQEEQLTYQLNEAQIQSEEQDAKLQEQIKADQQLEEEERLLMLELQQLQQGNQQLEQLKAETQDLIVPNPDKLKEERDLSEEELSLLRQEQAKFQATVNKFQAKLDARLEVRSQVKEHLSMLQSGVFLKDKVHQAKKDQRKQQSQLQELKSQKENINQELNTLKNDKKSRDQKEKQYQEQYQKLRDEIQSQIEARRFDKLEVQETYQGLSKEAKIMRDKHGQEKRDQMKIEKIRQQQLNDDIKDLGQLETYMNEYTNEIKNGIIALPELQ